jgi:hypothetical protein
MKQNPARVSLGIVRCGVEDAKELSDVATRSYNDFYLYLWHDNGQWYVNRCFTPSVFEKN